MGIKIYKPNEIKYNNIYNLLISLNFQNDFLLITATLSISCTVVAILDAPTLRCLGQSFNKLA